MYYLVPSYDKHDTVYRMERTREVSTNVTTQHIDSRECLGKDRASKIFTKEKKVSRFIMIINIDIEIVANKVDWLNIDKDGTSIHDNAKSHSPVLKNIVFF